MNGAIGSLGPTFGAFPTGSLASGSGDANCSRSATRPQSGRSKPSTYGAWEAWEGFGAEVPPLQHALWPGLSSLAHRAEEGLCRRWCGLCESEVPKQLRVGPARGQKQKKTTRGRHSRGANQTGPCAIHPSHRLKPTHPWCHPRQPSAHRDQPTAERPEPLAQLDLPMVRSTWAIERSGRSRGSSRSIAGAIDSSHRLMWIARPSRRPQPSCQSFDTASDPVHTVAQVDRTPCRSVSSARVAAITRALSLFTGAADHIARGARCRAPPVRWCARVPQSLDGRVNRFSPPMPY